MNLVMTIREQQDCIPGVYMVNIMDSGARLQGHPRNKRLVGERLALLVRGKVYGEDILCEAPEAVDAKLEDGYLAISFAHVRKDLTIKVKSLKSLELFADEKEIKPHQVSIARDTLMVQAKACKQQRYWRSATRERN